MADEHELNNQADQKSNELTRAEQDVENKRAKTEALRDAANARGHEASVQDDGGQAKQDADHEEQRANEMPG